MVQNSKAAEMVLRRKIKKIWGDLVGVWLIDFSRWCGWMLIKLYDWNYHPLFQKIIKKCDTEK